MKEQQEEKPIYEESALNDNDNTPRYGVQLYGLKSKELSAYLTEKAIESFVPMHEVVAIDSKGKRKHELRPVISNLIFIKKLEDDRRIL